MKNRRKFWLVLSSVFLVMGLASCGTTGAKGDTGSNGTNGTDGNDGKDGTNGKDGTSMLTGTNDPTTDLGNEGDVYLNLTTYDLFKKVNGVWTKIGNIKGKDGKNGQDGEDGESGESGYTTYSSTILSCDHGYVTVNKGSAKVGESITFTFVADSSYKIDYFKVNNETFASTKLSNNTYTTTMISGGFVISANFILSSAKTNVITNATELETALESAGTDTVLTLIASTSVALTGVDINKEGVTVNITHNGSGSVDLNGVEISGTGAVFNLESSITNAIADSTPIIISGKGVTVNGNGATLTGENPISVTDKTGTSKINNVVINPNGGSGGSSYKEGNLFNGIVAKTTDNNSKTFNNVAIRLDEGANVELENVTIGAGFDAAIYGYGDDVTTGVNNVTIKKCTISGGKYKGIYLGNIGVINIEDSTFDGTSVDAMNGTSTDEALKKSGSLIDLNQLQGVPSGKQYTITIKNNTFKNLTKGGSLASAINLKTSTTGSLTSVTINGNTFTNNIRDIVIGNGGVDTSVTFGTTSIQRDCNIYDNSGVGTLTSYIFENGQMYGFTAEDTGKNTKIIVTAVKFKDGDGTATHPLLISSLEEFKLLYNTNVQNAMYNATTNVAHELCFKLTANIALPNETSDRGKYSMGYFVGTLDGGGYELANVASNNTLDSCLIQITYGNTVLKNLKVVTNSGCLVRRSYDSAGSITFDKVDISGIYGATSSNTSNESAYLWHAASGATTFINCTASYDLIGNSYQAIFYGGCIENLIRDKQTKVVLSTFNTIATFKNLTYTGHAYSKQMALLIGSSNNFETSDCFQKMAFVVNNVKNEGTLYSYNKNEKDNLFVNCSASYTHDVSSYVSSITNTGTYIGLSTLENSKITLSSSNNKFDMSGVTNTTINSIDYIAHVYTNVYFTNAEHDYYGGTHYTCAKETIAKDDITNGLIGHFATMGTNNGQFIVNSTELNALQPVQTPSNLSYSLGTYDDATSTQGVVYDFYFKDSDGNVIGFQTFTTKVILD